MARAAFAAAAPCATDDYVNEEHGVWIPKQRVLGVLGLASASWNRILSFLCGSFSLVSGDVSCVCNHRSISTCRVEMCVGGTDTRKKHFALTRTLVHAYTHEHRSVCVSV